MKINPYVTLLTLLLQNSVIASFEYWSEFVLRLQRDEAVRHPALTKMFGSLRIPPLFCLRLRGIWRMGKQLEWEEAIQEFPLKGIPPVPVEAPMQASLLMRKLNKQILTVRVNEDSDLTLDLSDGSWIFVQGIGGGWDESWILELPVDDPDRDQWQIISETQGLIGGTFPRPINK